MDWTFFKTGLLSGTGSSLSLLTGGIFFDNLKMEKQRTGYSYYKISNTFYKNGIRGFYSGFIPWGFTLSYVKGFSVGFTNNILNENNFNNPMYKGILSGIVEASVANPFMVIRNNNNKCLEEGKKFKIKEYIKHNTFSQFYKGVPLYMLRRAFDWGFRFTFIDYIQNNNYIKKYENHYLFKPSTIFIGSALTTPLTTPIDSFLPILYTTKKKPIDIFKIYIKNPRLFFSGLLARSISTGYYTMCALYIPYLIKDLIK